MKKHLQKNPKLFRMKNLRRNDKHQCYDQDRMEYKDKMERKTNRR